MSDLERLYEVAPWPIRPADPGAQARFASTVELFELLLSNHAFFGFLSSRDRVRILDMMGEEYRSYLRPVGS